MTNETSIQPPKRNPLAEEAAEWFAKMRGPEADTHRPAFEAWLARGALHLAAYNRAVEIFSDGKFLGETDEPRPQPHALRSTGVGTAPPVRPRRRLLPMVVVAACAIMAIGLAVLARPSNDVLRPEQKLFAPMGRSAPGETSYATRAGETRTETLGDGSSVTLQPDSLLFVAFGSTRRDLRLTRGRARFEVAHDGRPFIVAAEGGSVTATGTVFEVSIAADRHVTVRLEQGSVDVALPASDSRVVPVRKLTPGQAVTYDAGPTSPIFDVAAPSDPRAHALRAGTLPLREFSRVSLSDLILEANKGSAVQIRLADAALSERTLSGRFRIGDTSKLADRLAVIFDLRVDRRDPLIIVLSAR
jgi:transmembrane sensor